MAFDEDLDQLYSAADPFCVLGVFSNGVQAYGNFIGATEGVDLMSGQPEANDPSFEVRETEVDTVRNEMTVAIDGTTYTVKRKQKVGTGATLIYLKT
jgi:hypothetical protein